MVKVRIRTESDTGEETFFEGESEDAYAEIKQQESDQFTSPRYQISDVEIEGYTPVDDEEYDNMLDEIYPEYKMGDVSYLPSRILKELDPIAYRIGRQEYDESRAEDIKSDVEKTVDYDDENEEGFWDTVFRTAFNW
tara:strand:- start:1526 stop:1936 length:411 start_codon:yes stop_codon:yes gene_type:complete